MTKEDLSYAELRDPILQHTFDLIPKSLLQYGQDIKFKSEREVDSCIYELHNCLNKIFVTYQIVYTLNLPWR